MSEFYFSFIIVTTCNADTYHSLYVFCKSRAKLMKFDSRYLGQGRQNRTKFCRQLERVLHLTIQTGDMWPRGSPLGAKILKGV